uniref:(northern house mosquito) hypothetical protein n=1 Tax=Culex pipiens TaxID=7175 RepID=A0A8D8P7K8_CULPI
MITIQIRNKTSKHLLFRHYLSNQLRWKHLQVRNPILQNKNMGLSQSPLHLFPYPGETLRETVHPPRVKCKSSPASAAAHLRRMVTLTHAKSVVNNGCPRRQSCDFDAFRVPNRRRGGFPPHFCAVRWNLVCSKGDRRLAPAKLLLPTRTGSDFIEQTNPGPSRNESVSSSGGTVEGPNIGFRKKRRSRSSKIDRFDQQ